MLVVADPVHEINGLLRLVTVPDQHILGKPEVGPEDRESKHEFTNIMQVILCSEFQVAFVFQVNYP